MREQGLKGKVAGWVKFQTEFIHSVEERIEKKDFTQQARRTHYQNADFGKRLFQGKDPLHASEWITVNIHM